MKFLPPLLLAAAAMLPAQTWDLAIYGIDVDGGAAASGKKTRGA